MKTKATTKKAKIQKSDKTDINNDYLISLKMAGKVYQSQGKTLKEAIENLPQINKVVGAVVLTVKHGNVSKDRILNVLQSMRLFTSVNLTKQIAVKNILNVFANI